MNVIEEQIQFWEEGNNAVGIEKSRFGISFGFQDIERCFTFSVKNCEEG